VLVRVKPPQPPAEVKPVFQPEVKPTVPVQVHDPVKVHDPVRVHNNLQQPRWTGAELKLIKDLRGQRLNNEEVVAAFQKVYPKRAASGIVAKACQLARNGEIKPLKKLKRSNRVHVKFPVTECGSISQRDGIKWTCRKPKGHKGKCNSDPWAEGLTTDVIHPQAPETPDPPAPVASSAKVDPIEFRTYQLTILIEAENFASASSVAQRLVEKYPEALITCMKEVQGKEER